MIQEAITYMIIGSAITLAVYKIYKKLGNNKSEKPLASKMRLNTESHVCSDCSAECMLRDATKSVILQNQSTCNSLKTKSD